MSPQKQARHIAGTKEYDRYVEVTIKKSGRKPSILYGDLSTAQALVDRHKATGIIKANGRDSISEVIRADYAISEYWGKDGKRYFPTTLARIIYTRTNVHIYPIWEVEMKKGER